MDAKWFAQYMHQVSANVVDRDGQVRFTYEQLKHSLRAVENGEDSRVPEPVRRLFANIVGVLPTVELDDRTQTLLFLALLNCHMAYGLVSGYTLKEDVSVENMV